MNRGRGLLVGALAFLSCLLGAGACAAAFEVWSDYRGRPETRHPAPSRTASAIPIGVLGDSDSHTYHDSVNFPGRFGRYQDVTFQWTEVLSRLRGGEVSFGPRGIRGARRSVARLMDFLGLDGRNPPKEDYLHSLAFVGAGCGTLLGNWGRQAPRLLTEMDRDPGWWSRGVVVIRIGVNDLGSTDTLNALARDPRDSTTRATIDRCMSEIGASISLIRKSHPRTLIVLVGLLNNADDPSTVDRWQSAVEYKNIRDGLAPFDAGLRKLALENSRVVFFDDRAWFEAHWGRRDEQGRPGYRTLFIGPTRFPVTFTSGDYPGNAVTQDLHAGVVWTTLWTQSLVAFIDASSDVHITPISDEEVTGFLAPAVNSLVESSTQSSR